MEEIDKKAAEVLRSKAVEALKDKLDEKKALWLVLYALWRRTEELKDEMNALKKGVEKLYDTAEVFAQLRRAIGDCYDRAVAAPKEEEDDMRKKIEKIIEGLSK